MACTNSSAGKCVQHRQARVPSGTGQDLSQMDKPDVMIKSCSAAEWLLRVARLGANRRPPTRPKEVGAGLLEGAAFENQTADRIPATAILFARTFPRDARRVSTQFCGLGLAALHRMLINGGSSMSGAALNICSNRALDVELGLLGCREH